ncbi:AAA family ATPase [Vibrio splendidus]
MTTRLVYCWVQEFRALANVDINLTNEYQFHYDMDARVLHVEKTDLPAVFERIKPVKAIVGENGCGKSSYLEVIEHTLLYGKNDFGFCVLEKSVDGKITFDVRTTNDADFEYNLVGFNASIVKKYVPFRISSNNMGLITFCNRNSSTIKRRSSRSKYYVDISSRIIDNPLSTAKKFIGFSELNPESKAHLSFSLLDIDVLDLMPREMLVKYFSVINTKFQYKQRHSEDFSFYAVVISAFFNSMLGNKVNVPVEHFINKYFSGSPSLDDFSRFLDEFELIAGSDLFKEYVDKFFVEDGYGCRLRFGCGEIKEIEGFLDYLTHIGYRNRTWTRYFKVKTEGISSGELQLFEIVSGLLSKESRELFEKVDNLVLLFDEPESHLHPEWQRQFLKTVLDTIDMVQTNPNHCADYQLLITSHSPFLISDLLDSNVTFLSKSGEASSRVANTFAANIHSLLLNDFFMKKTIGEVSSGLILDAIGFMKENKESNYITSIDDCDDLIAQVSNIPLKSELVSLSGKYKMQSSNYRHKKQKLIELLENDEFELFEEELRFRNV